MNNLSESIRNAQAAEFLAKHGWQRPPFAYLLAFAGVAVMTAIIYYTHADVSIANVPTLYLLVVTLCALFLGRTAAVLASIVAFLAFDWFFIDPKYQFTVQDPAEWLALCMFLLTSMVTGQLTAMLRSQVEEARLRRAETLALAEASWAVASELDRDRAMTKVVSQIAQLAKAYCVAALLPDADYGYKTTVVFSDPESSVSEASPNISPEAVALTMREAWEIGWDNQAYWDKALKRTDTAYLPVILENQVLCVIYLKLKSIHPLSHLERRVVSSLLNHAAVILQRDKLMKAEARAEALHEADKLKTALLSMVSHDFRSPLTSILASVSTLLEEGDPVDPETQRSLLQGVDQEATRLNRMVGNILDLSRLEAGAWRSRVEPAEATELIGSALDSFSAEANGRIHVDVDSRVKELTVDSVQMVQVVRNLLENALKYSPDNSQIDLNLQLTEDSVIVAVLDRGSGLPKGDEQKVFEAFYRAPGLKESSVPGVGIGLALCRGLVEANGGVLTAINRPGGGAIFRVTLPKNLAILRQMPIGNNQNGSDPDNNGSAEGNDSQNQLLEHSEINHGDTKSNRKLVP